MGHPRHLQRPALDPSAGCVPLIRLVGRRLLLTLPTLLGVLVVAFLLLNVAPGDPVTAMVGERADSATIAVTRSEEHTSELQSQSNLVCRLLLEKKKKYHN